MCVCARACVCVRARVCARVCVCYYNSAVVLNSTLKSFYPAQITSLNLCLLPYVPNY